MSEQDRFKKVAVLATVVAAAAVVCSVALLLSGGPEGAPVVTLKLDPDDPTNILVDPPVSTKVVFNDIVVFSNETKLDVIVKFASPIGGPFLKDEFPIAAGQASPVPEAAVIIAEPDTTTDYPYTVVATSGSSGVGTNQSPVIRVGPRPHSSPG